MIRFDLQRFAGDKTERATPARRRELRREGRLAKSPELTGAAGLAAAMITLRIWGPTMWRQWRNAMQTGLTVDPVRHSFGQTQVLAILDHDMMLMARLLAPIAAVTLVVGAVTAFIQIGPLFAPQLLKPDFQRVQPFAGVKRLFSAHTLAEAVKSILKLAVVASVAYVTVRGMTGKISQLSTVGLTSLSTLVGGMVFRIGIELAAAFLLLSGFDFVWQRYDFERSIRMSLQEVKEEMRRQEGDPLIRSKIRQRGRALAMRRMMQDVKAADVVVTNPTHFAVALQYQAQKMSAPTVVAKGQGEVAARIRQLADDAGVPLMENRPLAQALYRAVDVGGAVPADLYQAVAEVLATVYRLKQDNGRR